MPELILISVKLKSDSPPCRVNIPQPQKQIAAEQQIQPVSGLPIIMSVPISGGAQQRLLPKPFSKPLKAPA
jgi:hypothetical protein